MHMLQSGNNTPVGIPVGAGTSGGMQSMKKMLRYFWTSPLEVLAIKDQLKERLKPDPLRAEELKQELSKGMQGIAQRVWPKMKNISCVVD